VATALAVAGMYTAPALAIVVVAVVAEATAELRRQPVVAEALAAPRRQLPPKTNASRVHRSTMCTAEQIK
jgi:hypothetical protein